MGVSVNGKIAIARYGRSYRGIKAREAEKHGALGLIIYSDPADDGYVRGDVYPLGPMRPSQGVQRGSVMNPNGDPSTPGYPSTTNAKRIALSAMDVPHIPVLPISYGNAAELLRGLTGKSIPQTWQGGLPFRYHVGPGPVQARLEVVTDAATRPYKEIWDTFGSIRGSEFPDELVLIGGHRDAWGPGAGDPGGGSDFAGFYNHLGIPIADWGFGGPQGVYHSAYDSYHWMSKFGDPNFEVHTTAARIGAAMLLRIANADILPYDYVEFVRTMRRFGAQVGQAISDKHWKVSAAGLAAAIGRMEDAALASSAARDKSLTAQLAPATAQQVNAKLLEVERQLTRPEGLVSRPWFRNLIYASDENNGYATMVLPSVNEAIRVGNETVVDRELTDLVQRFDAATRALKMATELLSKK